MKTALTILALAVMFGVYSTPLMFAGEGCHTDSECELGQP